MKGLHDFEMITKCIEKWGTRDNPEMAQKTETVHEIPKWPIFLQRFCGYKLLAYNVIWNVEKTPKMDHLSLWLAKNGPFQKKIMGHFGICITWTVSSTVFLGSPYQKQVRILEIIHFCPKIDPGALLFWVWSNTSSYADRRVNEIWSEKVIRKA